MGRDSDCGCAWHFLLQHKRRLRKSFPSQYGLFSESYKCIPNFRKYAGSLRKLMNCSEIRQKVFVRFVRLVVGVMLVMSLSVAVSKTSSCKFRSIYILLLLWTRIRRFWKGCVIDLLLFPCTYFTAALTEENLLFLEAWRTIDRAYVDKTFNGQSWFRYREDALRNEPMNTREETCNCLVIYDHLYKRMLHLAIKLIWNNDGSSHGSFLIGDLLHGLLTNINKCTDSTNCTRNFCNFCFVLPLTFIYVYILLILVLETFQEYFTIVDYWRLVDSFNLD